MTDVRGDGANTRQADQKRHGIQRGQFRVTAAPFRDKRRVHSTGRTQGALVFGRDGLVLTVDQAERVEVPELTKELQEVGRCVTWHTVRGTRENLEKGHTS